MDIVFCLLRVAKNKYDLVYTVRVFIMAGVLLYSYSEKALGRAGVMTEGPAGGPEGVAIHRWWSTVAL